MTSDTQGSVWSYSLELSRALSGHGIRVSLSTFGHALSKEQRRDAARVPRLALFESELPMAEVTNAVTDFTKSHTFLTELEHKLKPDIIQLNEFNFGSLRFKAPVVIVAHSEGSPSTSASIWQMRRELTPILQSADLVIFPTRAALEEAKLAYQLTTPCKVIPYFRRIADYRTASKQRYVFSAGDRNDAAAVMTAIEAAAGELHWPVISMQERGITGGVPSRPGARPLSPRIADQLSKAAIYCQPAPDQRADISVLEGALSRCALVIADVPGLRENWNNCALFVPQNDTEILKRNLQMLIADDKLREEFALRAFERAKEFSPDRCIDDYLDAYQSAWSYKFRPESTERR